MVVVRWAWLAEGGWIPVALDSLSPSPALQTRRGADTASSWLPSGTSWERSTQRAPTPSSPRWTPPPTRSRRSKCTASPRSSTSLQETNARSALLPPGMVLPQQTFGGYPGLALAAKRLNGHLMFYPLRAFLNARFIKLNSVLVRLLLRAAYLSSFVL